jgi:prephenate dehydrogenase
MKIGIVGLGLIGGSIALAATAAGHDVCGTDAQESTIEKLLEANAISYACDLRDMTTKCDLIILCTPARTTVELVGEALSGNALVTDVASVKEPITHIVESLGADKADRFIGGHPMAGSEQSGFDAARDDLFNGKMWILVPPESNSLRHLPIVEEFVSSLGAEHCILSAQQHDRLVAYISHLPQFASLALMDLAVDKSVDNEILLRLAGGGFRDMTRIAAGNVNMWLDIAQDNAAEIVSSLNSYIERLNDIKSILEKKEAAGVISLFERAGHARRSLPSVARRLENLCEIHIPVPDKPGVLTTITALADGINLYDIRINHALEDDRGVLSVVVEPDAGQPFVEKLNSAGFTARIVDLVQPEE